MAPHPAFGSMTKSSWGILAYKHIDHHLRQFGAWRRIAFFCS
ncbi:MAG: DUF1569 domain-containing protein [Gemmatimonadota bacterium]